MASILGFFIPGLLREQFHAWSSPFPPAITIEVDRHDHHDHHGRATCCDDVMVVMVVPSCLRRRKRGYASADRPSHAVGFQHPRRNIPLAVQYAPDIDVVLVLDVENEVRIARQRPGAQAGKIEFMGVARGACGGMASNVGVSLLQRIDETKRDAFAGLLR